MLGRAEGRHDRPLLPAGTPQRVRPGGVADEPPALGVVEEQERHEVDVGRRAVVRHERGERVTGDEGGEHRGIGDLVVRGQVGHRSSYLLCIASGREARSCTRAGSSPEAMAARDVSSSTSRKAARRATHTTGRRCADPV